MGPGRRGVHPYSAYPRTEVGSKIHPEDCKEVCCLPRRREGPKRPALQVEADGWLRKPGIPTLSLALRGEEDEEPSVRTNRYDVLMEDDTEVDVVESTPQPLPQRAVQRYRRPPYVPPLSVSSSGSGVEQQPAVELPSSSPGVVLNEEVTTTVSTKTTPQPLQESVGQRHRTPSPMGPLSLNSWEVGVRGQVVEGTSSQDARLCGTQQPKIPVTQRPPSGPVQRLRGAETTKKSVSWGDTAVMDGQDSSEWPQDDILASGAVGGGCLYVPGNLGTKKVTYLVDTGCSHNLLSKSVFDRMPSGTRHQLVPLETAAAMADGSGLPIYGRITLQGRVRNMRFEGEFLVSRIADDAILGMVFLKDQECTLSCDKGILVMGTETVLCTDQRGNLLSNKVQVLGSIVIPPEAEMQVCCRLNSEPSSSLGLVENGFTRDTGLAVAATLCVPDNRRRLLVRCLNATREPQELRSGTIIGLYQSVGTDQIVEEGHKIGCCRRFQGDGVPATCPETHEGSVNPSPEDLRQ